MAWDAEAERRALIGRIRRRMKALGWTNIDLAKAAKISPPHVRAILNPLEGPWPGGDKLIRFPDILRCGYRWFFTGEGNETALEAPPSQQMIEGYRQAIQDMEECLEEVKLRRLPAPRGVGPEH